ncbi:MAG TPA: DUF2157 domain-containing protein [Bryobacteraceae bacterium]|nr:DUF2157 domain-containing protein [Bryobacteraceae bacterium]
MESELEAALRRWSAAGLLDADAIERIRAFEAVNGSRRRARWPTIVAVTFGALALSVGIVLFVSAHWDRLSPAQRMSMLVILVAGLHAAAAVTYQRNHAVGSALHATGTLSLGAAIAIAGQIFNLQEHWPSALLVWSVGAWAAWLLLRHWSQFAIAAILTPAWLVAEWTVAASPSASPQIPAAGVLLCALCYLSACLPGRDSAVRRSLTWIGSLVLLPSAVVAASIQIWTPRQSDSVATIGWLCAILLPLGLAFLLRGRNAWMNAAAAGWTVLLVILARERFALSVYAWCVVGAVGLVAWGIHEASSERINLGMAGFAIALVAFFFSNIMDKLDRSASLITLGILFLAGGWYWEKLRRGLVARATRG